MFCSTGATLHHLYEVAEQQKAAITSQRDPLAPKHPALEKEIHAAKQRYVEDFANWLSHKAFCQDCKPKAPSRGEKMISVPGQSGISSRQSQAG